MRRGAAGIFLLCLGLIAKADVIKPGLYRLSQQGSVEVKNLTAKVFDFSLSNITGSAPSVFLTPEEAGLNPRLCEFEGQARIVADGAIYEGKTETGKSCEIKFSILGGELTLADGCGTACGVSEVRFDDGSCAEPALKAKRRAFQAFYDQKNYPAAVGKMQSIFAECEWALSNPDRSLLRNDLALAFLRKGDPKRCLSELEQADDYDIPRLQKAKATNLRLCKKAANL